MKFDFLSSLEEAGQTLKVLLPVILFVHFFIPGGLEAIQVETSTSSICWYIAACVGLSFVSSLVREIYKVFKLVALKIPEKA